MGRLSVFDWLAVILVFLGASGWLASGLFGLNLVRLLIFNIEWIGRAFYVTTGLAGIWVLFMAFRLNRT